LVSVLDDFHEVAALLGVETLGSPVIEDEEVCLGERTEQAGVAAIGASQLQFGEHPGEAFVEHRDVDASISILAASALMLVTKRCGLLPLAFHSMIKT
jgi:hypothetical protein